MKMLSEILLAGEDPDVMLCPECHTPISAEDYVCAACGQELEPVETTDKDFEEDEEEREDEGEMYD